MVFPACYPCLELIIAKNGLPFLELIIANNGLPCLELIIANNDLPCLLPLPGDTPRFSRLKLLKYQIHFMEKLENKSGKYIEKICFVKKVEISLGNVRKSHK